MSYLSRLVRLVWLAFAVGAMAFAVILITILCSEDAKMYEGEKEV